LRQALLDRQLCLRYQPIMDLRNRQLIGVEAMLRWQHPTLGLLLPREFIPMAEETGLIVDIGAWALNEACDHVLLLEDAGQQVPRLSINLSLRQLHDDNLPRSIARILDETRLDALWLNLEITERRLLQEDLLSRLTFLHDHGRIGIALTMDNFRSAGSSLGLLKHLPITIIKIEHELVSRLLDDQAARDISLTLIAMAHHLDLMVLAENVETQAQYDFLFENGCDYAQGSWFHPALTLDELPAVLDDALMAR
jgi:EAL domain-containing protein (putative c-di-GMP-specific phosphodiesterase class I)